MVARYEFEKELNRLHRDIVKMGALIEKSMEDMILSLRTKDVELAEKVIAGDDVIDDMERQIAEECMVIIARQQPIATDLRDIASILKIVTDMERIADHCEDISTFIVRLAGLNAEQELPMIPVMVSQVKQMISQTIDAYIRKDLPLAIKVIEQDDQVDELFEQLIDELVMMMEEQPSLARQNCYYLFIIKYLERMADHAVNVAEWIYYYVTGDLY